ncbi:glycoside hydrolase family 19 protein [Brevundimonas sp.]|uniref:glycoside hydrolase family 19 protein n=1 Tax=Brevundimonas sp. TaxID=1871086 RepID=UPI0025C10492|nr:glycoside hydrolase family 19 protein [Brevundimonas sp.]
MTRDHATLFAFLRNAPFGGRLTKDQVQGVERLIAAWDEHGVDDDRQLAYLLATDFRETGGRMQPVRETFATSGAQAIRRLDAAYASGALKVSKPYWRDGWFGRGDVQVTHKQNYHRMSTALGLDLIANPGLLLDPEISARSIVVGMRQGLFAPGHDLDRYFNATTEDPEGARRIVNGTDKASLIAGYYRNFLDSLIAARKEAAKVVLSGNGRAAAEVTKLPVPSAIVEAAKPDGADLKTDKTAIGGVLAGLGGIGGAAAVLKPVLEGVTNPWALAAFVVVLLAAGLVLTGRRQLKVGGGV